MPDVSQLRDDFADSIQSPAWGASGTSGSATKAETSGQVRFTLPSSTAGTHSAYYATPFIYTLTGDSFYINIQTMVATGVAASAFFQLVWNSTNYLQWIQASGTLKAQKIISGIATDLYSVAWNATTYKYLRISESGGTITFASSTNGTSWTTRATLANPYAVVGMQIVIGASCGNVASPGSFRLDDVNLILPALSTNWRYTTVEWPLLNRYRTVTISASSGQGYIAVANDTARNANGEPTTLTSPRYFSGPIGSSSGGFDQLTEYATQAEAQAMAVDMPADGRWDLPDIEECRFIRLYHRSNTGAGYTIYEYYPRRLVQADDIEAEQIRALHIAAGVITADKIYATFTITGKTIQTNTENPRAVMNGDQYGGFIGYGAGDTFDPVAGVGTYQVYWSKADGRLYWANGVGILDDTGIQVTAPASLGNTNSYRFTSGGTTVGGLYGWDNGSNTVTTEVRAQPIAGRDSQVVIEARYAAGRAATARLLASDSAGAGTGITVQSNDGNEAITIGDITSITTIFGGLNVGLGSGSVTGQIKASANSASLDTIMALSGGAGFYAGLVTGRTAAECRLMVAAATGQWTAGALAGDMVLRVDSTSRKLFLAVGGSEVITVGNQTLSFFAGTPQVKQTVTGSRGGNAALGALLTALAAYGLVTDSSSA